MRFERAQPANAQRFASRAARLAVRGGGNGTSLAVELFACLR
jgi:hypothetical protein